MSTTARRWPGCGRRVAPHWRIYAEYADARAAEVTAAAAGPRRGRRRATGYSSWPAAPAEPGWRRLTGSVLHGQVVLSDLAPEMTAIARDRAAELGLTNITARSLDLQQIDEPDGSFDVVLCREGLMFAPDPAAALTEIRRVLRAGRPVGRGRLGSAGAQSLARSGLRRGHRRNRATGAAARHPRAVRAGRPRTAWSGCSEKPGSADVRVTEQTCPMHDESFDGVVDTHLLPGRTADRAPRGDERAATRCRGAARAGSGARVRDGRRLWTSPGWR